MPELFLHYSSRIIDSICCWRTRSTKKLRFMKCGSTVGVLSKLERSCWQTNFHRQHPEFSQNINGGGLPAFCRSLHQMASAAAAKCGIMRQNVSLQLKLASILKKRRKSRISQISSQISTVKYKLLHDSYLNAFANNLNPFSSRSSVPSSSQTVFLFLV